MRMVLEEAEISELLSLHHQLLVNTDFEARGA